jgi:hypothetical protein
MQNVVPISIGACWEKLNAFRKLMSLSGNLDKYKTSSISNELP